MVLFPECDFNGFLPDRDTHEEGILCIWVFCISSEIDLIESFFGQRFQLHGPFDECLEVECHFLIDHPHLIERDSVLLFPSTNGLQISCQH